MSASESIKFELPAEIRQALGDIVIVWSRVESLIAELLTFLLNANPGAMYVLNQDIASGTQNIGAAASWRAIGDGKGRK